MSGVWVQEPRTCRAKGAPLVRGLAATPCGYFLFLLAEGGWSGMDSGVILGEKGLLSLSPCPTLGCQRHLQLARFGWPLEESCWGEGDGEPSDGLGQGGGSSHRRAVRAFSGRLWPLVPGLCVTFSHQRSMDSPVACALLEREAGRGPHCGRG